MPNGKKKQGGHKMNYKDNNIFWNNARIFFEQEKMGARVVANGISQKAYEDGYSVSKSSIDNYLKGGMPNDERIYGKVANLLDVTVEELCTPDFAKKRYLKERRLRLLDIITNDRFDIKGFILPLIVLMSALTIVDMRVFPVSTVMITWLFLMIILYMCNDIVEELKFDVGKVRHRIIVFISEHKVIISVLYLMCLAMWDCNFLEEFGIGILLIGVIILAGFDIGIKDTLKCEELNGMQKSSLLFSVVIACSVGMLFIVALAHQVIVNIQGLL